MNIKRLLGYILLAIGIVLLGFGINASQAVPEKVMEGVSGYYTKHTMWFIMGSIPLIVAGAILAFRCCRKD